MKNTFPYYYKEFKCIADKCPDTCCAGWDVVLDKQSLERYLGTSGEIGKKLKSVIAVDSDGDDIFVSANGRCPFLMQNNLCEIYIELGEESLCRTGCSSIQSEQTESFWKISISFTRAVAVKRLYLQKCCPIPISRLPL